MHVPRVRAESVRLRKAGYSYTHISKVTGISKSTLSGWLTEIPYAPNTETIATFGKARAAASAKRAMMRQDELKTIRKKAKQSIQKVSKRDLFMFGLGLYLGEGEKTNDIVRIANSDPKIIQAAVSWFLSLGVSVEQFAPRIHLYPDSDIKKSLQFWSETTSIPIAQFQRPYVDTRTNKSKGKIGRLPHGTLHLGVRSMGKKEFGVLFFRTIHVWSEEVLRQTKRN